MRERRRIRERERESSMRERRREGKERKVGFMVHPTSDDLRAKKSLINFYVRKKKKKKARKQKNRLNLGSFYG